MKFNLDKSLPPILVFIVILGAIGGAIYYKHQNSQKPITRYKFYGAELQFRDDLRLAQNITVFPDEKSILNKVWDPNITRIKLVYVPTPEPSTENSLLSLGIIEIRYKLDIAYRQFDWVNEFNSTELKSYDNITSAGDTLVVALVRPSLSNKTSVELNGNTVYIKGVTGKDFDLATIKFIMSALNITV